MIKSVSLEYRCDKEYLKVFDKRKNLKYSSLLAVLLRNRLDPGLLLVLPMVCCVYCLLVYGLSYLEGVIVPHNDFKIVLITCCTPTKFT